MSRAFDDASSQYLEYAGAVVALPPFSLSCHFKPDDSLTSGLMAITRASSVIGTAADQYLLRTVATTNVINAARERGDGTYQYDSLSTADAATLNAWNHAALIVSAVNDVRLYINGGGKVTSSVTVEPKNLDRTTVGRRTIAGGGSMIYFSGLIAWPGIWSVALSDAEVASLAAGAFPPSIQPASIVDLWDLTRNVSPETPWVGSHNLTVNGATYSADNPPVAMPGYVYRANQ